MTHDGLHGVQYVGALAYNFAFVMGRQGLLNFAPLFYILIKQYQNQRIQ